MTSKAKAAIFVLTAVFCIVAVVPGFCAGKKAAAGTKKVPASILNGSDVTSGRVFRTLKTKETYLAGVRLGDNALKILEKYGNPTRVIIHSAAQAQNTGMMGTGMTGTDSTLMGGVSSPSLPGMGATAMPTPSMPGTTGTMSMPTPTMPSTPSMPTTPSTPSMPTPTMPGSTGTMDMPTPSMPGSPSMPSMPGMGGAVSTGQQAASAGFAGTSSRIDDESLCWQYELPAGTNMEFIVTNGKISQITVVSLYPWKYARMSSGIMIGDTYKLVTYLMGIDPSNLQIIGNYLRMDYMDKYGIAYTFLNKKLVGLTIAVGDPIYN
ncbi:MAG: hypothetical protein IJT95_02320 [Abditibacteriota bacterium]|nr:hypothetical protein [Abditibacteriota bacterium]